DTLTWSGLSIASGGSVVLTYEATVLAPGVGISFTNVAQVIASDQFDPNSTPDNDVPTEDDYDSVTPRAQIADLSLTKTISNLNPIVGDVVIFTLTINNAGPDSATNVSIGDAIPNGYGNITNISNSGNLLVDSLVWNIPTILSGNSQILTYKATVLPPLSGISYTNIAQVVGVDQFDPNSTPNNNIPTEDDQDQVVITLDNSIPIAVAGTGFTITCVDNTLGQEIGEIAEIGHTYSWSPSIGLSDANISNPIALPSITTIYTVTKTNIVNGFTATASIVVAVDTIMPLPTILGNDTISVLQSNVLRIAQGGESYLWSNGLGTNDTVSISTPGIYTVTAKSLNGCTATATTEVIEVRFGSIGDLVWADYNNNGVQELTESFMDSIKVYLYDGTGTVLLDSTISDINGKYLFDSLPSGNYKLFFKTPSEAMVSPQYNGIDTLDSDINTSGWTETISIDVTKPVNDTLRNNTKKDAGYVPYGSIGDYVFEDKDFSNTQNAGDTPLPNVTVYLLNASGVIIDTTVSGIDGKYVFNNVINGDYRLQFVKPVGMNADLKNIGSDSELDSDADPITGITDLFNVNTTLTLNDPLRNLNAMDAGFNFYDPKIRLTKDGVLVGTGLVGDKITYGFTVLNTGNITLSNVFIEDTLISNSPISVSPNVLAPNQTGFAIAHYTLLAADIERGYVANSALVFGTDPIGVTVTDTSDNVNP
ncbi:DUF11 domain-containing protein, partial [Lacihabitans sp. LS3-19]|uniref:SdrD B-like domain-containing protein n=1 Tax=Lacihabitans sp. LS3-19 TaxID=2487335 RepID=UPI00286E4260